MKNLVLSRPKMTPLHPMRLSRSRPLQTTPTASWPPLQLGAIWHGSLDQLGPLVSEQAIVELMFSHICWPHMLSEGASDADLGFSVQSSLQGLPILLPCSLMVSHT